MSTETNEAKENDVFGVAIMPCRMNSVKMVTNGNCKEYVLSRRRILCHFWRRQ